MKIIKNEVIKLDRYGFNSMPERKEIEALLKEMDDCYEVVDTDKEYWSNTYDTLVIVISEDKLKDKTMKKMIALANFVRETRVDEFFTTKHGKKTIIRLWWD